MLLHHKDKVSKCHCHLIKRLISMRQLPYYSETTSLKEERPQRIASPRPDMSVLCSRGADSRVLMEDMKCCLCLSSSCNTTTPVSSEFPQIAPPDCSLPSCFDHDSMTDKCKVVAMRGDVIPRMGLCLHLTPVTEILDGIISAYGGRPAIPALLTKASFSGGDNGVGLE